MDVDAGAVRRAEAGAGRRGFVDQTRFVLALAAGKLLIRLLKWLRQGSGGGTSLPGQVALRIYPRVLSDLVSTYGKVVVVTGTNGKTTTTMGLSRILKHGGLYARVASNAEGANMLPGLTTALLRDHPLSGAPAEPIAARAAVLEVDEGSMEGFCRQGRVDAFVVTNLFRDQLDRYWEIGRLAGSIRLALDLHPQATLILNADDPAVAHLGTGREKVVFYGMKPIPAPEASVEHNHSPPLLSADEARDSILCPVCITPLEYMHYFYSHLGQYRCLDCAVSRPVPDYLGEITTETPDTNCQNQGTHAPSLVVHYGESLIALRTPLTGNYNYYNLLAATVAALDLGAGGRAAVEGLAGFSPGLGRFERFAFPGVLATLVLTKNPTGMSQALRAIVRARGRAAGKQGVLLAINDLAADGRDVSWLWDCSWTPLVETSWDRVVCSGLRALDMAVCLKYSGLAPAQIEVAAELEEAIRGLVALDGPETGGNVFILSTYTNLTPCRTILRKLGGKGADAVDTHLPPVS